MADAAVDSDDEILTKRVDDEEAPAQSLTAQTGLESSSDDESVDGDLLAALGDDDVIPPSAETPCPSLEQPVKSGVLCRRTMTCR